MWPGRQRGKRFRVVVADARPEGEGRATLHALLGAGIACTYVLLNSVPLVMQASWSPLPSHMLIHASLSTTLQRRRVSAAVLTSLAAMPCLSLMGAGLRLHSC